MKIVTKKTIKKECWNIDFELTRWLNEHLKVYLVEADKKVDLSFHRFSHRGKTYTLKEMVERLIEITDYMLNKGYEADGKEFSISRANGLEKAKNEMYDILKVVHWHLWW